MLDGDKNAVLRTKNERGKTRTILVQISLFQIVGIYRTLVGHKVLKGKKGNYSSNKQSKNVKMWTFIIGIQNHEQTAMGKFEKEKHAHRQILPMKFKRNHNFEFDPFIKLEIWNSNLVWNFYKLSKSQPLSLFCWVFLSWNFVSLLSEILVLSAKPVLGRNIGFP